MIWLGIGLALVMAGVVIWMTITPGAEDQHEEVDMEGMTLVVCEDAAGTQFPEHDWEIVCNETGQALKRVCRRCMAEE
jgi:hypothetical protein